MRIRTRGDEVDITLGTRFIEVYAGAKYGPVVFMEATSDPIIKDNTVSWMAKNIVTGEMVRYGVNLEYWKYSPALCLPNSIVFNEKIKPYRPWPIDVLNKNVFASNKRFKRCTTEEEMKFQNRITQLLKKIFPKNDSKEKQTKKLYKSLSLMRFNDCRFRIHELDEGISVIEQVIDGWWKQRYLMNENEYRAYEIMDEDLKFVNFTTDDIDWKSIKCLPEYMKERARNLSVRFPTFVRRFQNGVAEAYWQLNPDGRYYRDEDGYGMTDDEETSVYGFIDTEMNMLVKFQYIGSDRNRLKEMRIEAERKVKGKSSHIS